MIQQSFTVPEMIAFIKDIVEVPVEAFSFHLIKKLNCTGEQVKRKGECQSALLQGNGSKVIPS